jgi:hypothetical protein
MLEVSGGKNRSLPGQGYGFKYLSKILDRFIGSLAERKHPQDVYCAISKRDRGTSRVAAWIRVVKFEMVVISFKDS